MADDADPDRGSITDRNGQKAQGGSSRPTDGTKAAHNAGLKLRLSDMLLAIANDNRRERISITDLLSEMDTRAMGRS